MLKQIFSLESCLLTFCIWLLLVAVSASAGGIGLSWDALNHHIYLGWTAQGHRFDQDALPAASQSLQFPYLYWPAYQLAMHGAGPVQAAAVLSAFHALVVPALWAIAHMLIPGPGAEALILRASSVVMAFLSPVILALTDNTANDLMAAMPLVWAIALGLGANDPEALPTARRRRMLVSGILVGVATAVKFSNGPLALLLPLVWGMGEGSGRWRVQQVLVGGLATIAGFLLTYGYWGWLLWTRFGNPIYPFYDSLFAPIRQVLGWMP